MGIRKIIISICVLFPVCGFSEKTGSNEPDSEKNAQALRHHLKEIRTKELDDEVKGQGLMIADWPAYSKEIEEIRKLEREEVKIEGEIQQLEDQKHK